MTDDVNRNESVQNPMSGPILVPLDGSDVAENVLPYVCEVARSAGTPLLLLGVVDPDAIDYPSSAQFPSRHEPAVAGRYDPTVRESRHSSPVEETGVIFKDQVEASALAYATDRLKLIASRLNGEGVTTEIRTTLGSPAEEILKVAEEAGCGLIAMSTHGRSRIARGILGSVTDRVIHSSRLPVLAVAPGSATDSQESERAASKTAVVPLDGSELAEQALPYAVELARALSLEVLLVRVVNITYPVHTYGGYVNFPEFTDRLVHEARSYLIGVANDLRRRGLTVRVRVFRGSPARTLLDFAQETPHNLVVMTTHGRTGMSRWLMGSVADSMVRASGDPVLVVRPNG